MKIQFELESPTEIFKIDRIVKTEFGRALRTASKSYYNELGKQFVVHDALASEETFEAFEISPIEYFGDRMEIVIAPLGDREQAAGSIANWKVMQQIESGRGIGETPVPAKALLEWMEDRGIGEELNEKQKSRMAFAIQRSIEYNGIEPRLILEKSESVTRKRIQNIFIAAMNRVAKRVGGTVEQITSDEE